MPELDLDAIERRARNQRATDEDLIDLVTEVRHLVQQRDHLAKQLEASKAAHAADYAHLDEQIGHLRAAVDAALAVHRSRELNFTRVPPGSSIEEAARIYESTPKRLICDAEHENYPCATVRALAPNKREQRQEASS